MDARELRIGNLLKTIDGNQTMVTDIFHPSMKSSPFMCFGYRPEDVEPIPLTGEWLESFGFDRTGPMNGENLIQFDLGNCFIYFHPRGKYTFSWRNSAICKIKHVHQLQNLYFSLTGEELELDGKLQTR